MAKSVPKLPWPNAPGTPVWRIPTSVIYKSLTHQLVTFWHTYSPSSIQTSVLCQSEKRGSGPVEIFGAAQILPKKMGQFTVWEPKSAPKRGNSPNWRAGKLGFAPNFGILPQISELLPQSRGWLPRRDLDQTCHVFPYSIFFFQTRSCAAQAFVSPLQKICRQRALRITDAMNQECFRCLAASETLVILLQIIVIVF